MKKQSLVAVLLVMALFSTLAGCGGGNATPTEAPVSTPAATPEPTPEPTPAPTEVPAVTYTVTFMNGETVLGTATGNEGQVLDPASYADFENQPDFEFLGWFETPSFLESSRKDLASLALTADLTLYGSFKNLKVAEDTRAWYIVGASTSGGILAGSNWANAAVEEADREQFRLQPTGKATNEVSITLDLYDGDQFQIIHDWAWDDQKGFGAFTEIDETQMANGGGLGGTSDTSNINVIMDGNYTITLTTDPEAPAQDTLTIVRNGDPVNEAQMYQPSESTRILVKGSWVDDWSDLKELTRVEGDGNVFTITMDLDAGTQLCFMVYDNGADTGLVLKDENVTDEASRALLEGSGGNVVVAAAGTYVFTVDADTMSVTVSAG